MRVRRFAALAVIPALVAGGLTACTDSGSDKSTKSGDTNAVVSIGIAEPKHLSPPNAGETSGLQVIVALYAGLMDYDKSGKPFDVLADSVTTTDSKVWTIKIKDGFTFHNGEKVNSDSFINAWNWGAYGPNASDVNSYYSQIQGYDELNPGKGKPAPTSKTLSGLKKVDDLTFTVTLTDPFIDFNTELGYTAFFPMPKAAFDASGDIVKGYEDAPIGNGPFKMKGTWKHDQAIEVERFDGWKGDKPKIGGINFKIYQDLKTQYADALGGALDIVPTVDTSNLANAKNDFGDRYKTSPSSSFQFLGFPTYDPTFSKVEIRKAISMAINRDEQVKTIFAGTQTAARSFVSPIIPGARKDTCGEACKYDPAAAKKLYTQAGGPPTLQITYNADGGHKEWIEATCNQLQQSLGVTCQAKPETKFADLLKKVEDKVPGVGVIRLGWVMDYPSLYDYLQPIFTTNGSANYYGYSNKTFDDLVAKGTTAKTQQEAIKIWQQAEDILGKDLPVIPMRFGKNNYVYTNKIKNAYANLFTVIDPLSIETK